MLSGKYRNLVLSVMSIECYVVRGEYRNLVLSDKYRNLVLSVTSIESYVVYDEYRILCCLASIEILCCL